MEIEDVLAENEWEDSILDDLSEILAEADKRTTIVNPNRLQEFQFVSRNLKYMTKDSDVEMTYKVFEPYKSSGCISLVAEDIQFFNMPLFSEICKLVDNIDIYTLTDGKIKIDFSFEKLSIPIE